MSRIEFMEELEALLKHISVEDRTDALQFYNNYFDDAGEDQEDVIIKELESPQKVARIILSSFEEGEEKHGNYTEQGYYDDRYVNKDEISFKQQNVKSREKTENKGKVSKIIVIILILLFGWPFILAILGVIVAIIVAIVSVPFALLISGLAVVVTGVACMFLLPATGLLVTGVGLVLTVVGVALSILVVRVIIRVMVPLLKGVINLCRRPFHTKEVTYK